MFFGHYAVAVAVKAKKPEIPVAPLLFGTGFMDIMNGLFIMSGIDTVTPNLKTLPYLFFDLTFIDWDHSLLMAMIWSLVFGLICWLLYKKDKKIGIAATLVTFAHFLCDLPLHNADMALYPNSDIKMGFGLWGSLGVGSWLLEVVFTVALLIYAWKKHKNRGENIWMQVAFVCLMFVNLSPWLSPMKTVATFPEPWAHLIHGLLVFIGFVVPGLILMWMYKRSAKQMVVSAN